MGGKPRKRLPEELARGNWPIRGLDGHAPRESDGFQRPGPHAKRGGKGHLGHDFMYRRSSKGSENLPEYTKWFFCPSGRAQAVAPIAGVVGAVRKSKKQGWWVEVKHGQYMSVFRHLATVNVSRGDVVSAGELIGIISHAPKAGKRGINHLHWELWDLDRPGPRRRAYKIINAKPFLRRWVKLPELLTNACV